MPEEGQAMPSRHRIWLDRLLVLVTGLMVVVTWSMLPPRRVVLADRVRAGLAEPDFVMRFLQTTQTPFTFEDGFVTVPLNSRTRVRLRQMLAGLALYRETLAEEAAGPPTIPCRCEPRDDGTVAQVPDIDRTPAQAARLRDGLHRQYAAVLDAIHGFDSTVVGGTTFPTADLVPLRKGVSPTVALPVETVAAKPRPPESASTAVVTDVRASDSEQASTLVAPTLPSRLSLPSSTGTASSNTPRRSDGGTTTVNVLPADVASRKNSSQENSTRTGTAAINPPVNTWPPRLIKADSPISAGSMDRGRVDVTDRERRATRQ